MTSPEQRSSQLSNKGTHEILTVINPINGEVIGKEKIEYGAHRQEVEEIFDIFDMEDFIYRWCGIEKGKGVDPYRTCELLGIGFKVHPKGLLLGKGGLSIVPYKSPEQLEAIYNHRNRVLVHVAGSINTLDGLLTFYHEIGHISISRVIFEELKIKTVHLSDQYMLTEAYCEYFAASALKIGGIYPGVAVDSYNEMIGSTETPPVHQLKLPLSIRRGIYAGKPLNALQREPVLSKAVTPPLF